MKRTDARRSADQDVVVLIASWDGYRDVWAPVLSCLARQWPDCPYAIYLGSNTAVCDRGVAQTLRIGENRDYSANLLAMLDRLEHEWVIVLVDDLLLSSRVDTERLVAIVDEARRLEAGYVRLNAEPPYVAPLFSRSVVGSFLRELERGTPYRVSIAAGLWRRRVLRSVLRPGESAWLAERRGGARADKLPDAFMSVRGRAVLPFVHGIVRGRWTWQAARFLRARDLSAHLGSRPVGTLLEYARLQAYSWIVYLGVWLLTPLVGSPFRDWVKRRVEEERG
jgi:hypothetical protein